MKHPREPTPPHLATVLLSLCLPSGCVRETVLGDLREMYGEMAAADCHRRRIASWYWRQAFLIGARYLVRRTLRPRNSRILTSYTEDMPRGSSHLNEFLSDARFAVRSFRRAPGFAISAVLVLGIGIGAVSLMFSTFDSVVLQPLPFEQPDRLVWVWGTTERMPQNTISYDDYVDFRDGTGVFESLAAAMFRRTRVLTAGEGAERVITYPVSANFFETLGVSPQLGRSFLPEEEDTGQDVAAILSDGFWRRRYGGDPGVIGSTMTLDGVPARVVGVMPAGFIMPVGYVYPASADVWFPLQRNAGYAQGRGNNNFSVLGRLREGTSITEAQAQMDVVAQNIATAYPDEKGGWSATLVPLHERFFGSAQHALLLLAGLISLVPLVACANVASLFVARALNRRAELASRLALGASRPRVVRQLLTEGLVVALAGCSVGLGIACWGGEALRSFAPDALPRLTDIAVDIRALCVTLTAALIMVPLFGLAPAIRGTDMRIAEVLKVGGERGSSCRGSRLRSLLVVTQVAFCVMLMLVAGLFARSLVNLQNVDSGFGTENVLTINALLPDFKYSSQEELEQAWNEIDRRVQVIPGVRTVGLVDYLPLGAEGPMYYVWASERPPASAAERIPALRRGGSEGYFDALAIPLLGGRQFDETERWFGAGGPPVTIVNETLARMFFPGEEAVGKTLVLDWDSPVDLEVIGVASDILELGPGSDPIATFYLPVRRDYDMLSMLIAAESDPLSLVGAVRQVVHEVDDDITLSSIRTMHDRLSDSLSQARFRATVVAVFALVTLILSSVGLYGVLAFFVRNRTHEIGIRMALGSGTSRAAGLVLKQGMVLVGSGMMIGVTAAVIGGRVIRSWLFGISVGDPVTYIGVILVLATVAAIACLPPSLRAVRLNPVDVLNRE